MTERELIARILPGCERSPAQRNRPFEADAELLDLNGALWAVTTDEFSGAEDRFTGEDLPHLGANLVVATLSDLLAVGASPRFLLQALVLPREGSEAFACGLLEGVRQALAQTEECHLCGGDLGTAADWRWCGTALGPCPKPITRCFPAGTEVATLWVSGSVGDANLAAFTGNPPPRFEYRGRLLPALRQYALACIDTSGGLVDALWELHLQNPEYRFELDLDSVPFAPGVAEACSRLGVPPPAALLGGAGEYELLFAAPPAATTELHHLGAVPVGRATRTGQTVSGVELCRSGPGHGVQLEQPPPDARAHGDDSQYATGIVAMALDLERRLVREVTGP